MEKLVHELVTVCIKHGDMWYNDIYLEEFTEEDYIYYNDLVYTRGAKLLGIYLNYYPIGHLIEIDIGGII